MKKKFIVFSSPKNIVMRFYQSIVWWNRTNSVIQRFSNKYEVQIEFNILKTLEPYY